MKDFTDLLDEYLDCKKELERLVDSPYSHSYLRERLERATKELNEAFRSLQSKES